MEGDSDPKELRWLREETCKLAFLIPRDKGDDYLAKARGGRAEFIGAIHAARILLKKLWLPLAPWLLGGLCYVPGIVLSTKDRAVHKTVPSFCDGLDNAG